MTSDRSILTLTGVPESRLSYLGPQLRRSLASVGVVATPVVQPVVNGTRSDTSVLGQFALELLSSGAAVAAIECLKAYITRERSLVVEVNRPDGTKIHVSALNIDDENLKSAFSNAFQSHT